MISKDKIIKLVEALKDHCRSTRCEECKFFIDSAKVWGCEMRVFTGLFRCSPSTWDIKKIKELL